MTFGNIPAAYLFLLFIPLLILSVRGYARQRRAMAAFAPKSLFAALVTPPEKSRWWKHCLVPAALLFSILAFMRPLGGLRMDSVKQRGLDIIIALDVSASMLAEDTKPSRLVFSRNRIGEFLQSLRGDRVGLAAFSGSAILICPLTVDYPAVALALASIASDTIPRGGTSLANAVIEAMKGFPVTQEGPRVLIIVSDGEGHEGDMLQAADEAAKKGITIFTIGVGTAAGEVIPLAAIGGSGFLKDRRGHVVKSRLNEEGLSRIANRTGGFYLRAADAGPGLSHLQEKLVPLDRHETVNKTKQNHSEWFQLPLCLAFLLALEPFLRQRKKDE